MAGFSEHLTVRCRNASVDFAVPRAHINTKTPRERKWNWPDTVYLSVNHCSAVSVIPALVRVNQADPGREEGLNQPDSERRNGSEKHLSQGTRPHIHGVGFSVSKTHQKAST